MHRIDPSHRRGMTCFRITDSTTVALPSQQDAARVCQISEPSEWDKKYFFRDLAKPGWDRQRETEWEGQREGGWGQKKEWVSEWDRGDGVERKRERVSVAFGFKIGVCSSIFYYPVSTMFYLLWVLQILFTQDVNQKLKHCKPQNLVGQVCVTIYSLNHLYCTVHSQIQNTLWQKNVILQSISCRSCYNVIKCY